MNAASTGAKMVNPAGVRVSNENAPPNEENAADNLVRPLVDADVVDKVRAADSGGGNDIT